MEFVFGFIVGAVAAWLLRPMIVKNKISTVARRNLGLGGARNSDYDDGDEH